MPKLNDLSEKQKKFIDYFIETGNATEAASKAGYQHPRVQGCQNLTKLNKNLTEKLNQKQDERIASQDEVLRYLTSMMRGEVSEECIVVEGEGNGFSKAKKVHKQATPKDRNKAAELLAKRYGLDRPTADNTNESNKAIIIDDIPDEEGEEENDEYSIL